MAIDPRIESLALLRRIAVAVELLAGGRAATPQTDAAEGVDLDGKYGDPQVRAKDPRDWTGEPMKGRTFSQCPPEYLDLLAQRFDFFASREPDEKKAKYNRLDASRCRGWARRLRNGWKPAEIETGESSGFGGGFDVSGFEDVTEDPIPF